MAYRVAQDGRGEAVSVRSERAGSGETKPWHPQVTLPRQSEAAQRWSPWGCGVYPNSRCGEPTTLQMLLCFRDYAL